MTRCNEHQKRTIRYKSGQDSCRPREAAGPASRAPSIGETAAAIDGHRCIWQSDREGGRSSGRGSPVQQRREAVGVERIGLRRLEILFELVGEVQKGRDDGRVELASATSSDLGEGFRRRPRLLVGAVGDERVEDVADRADTAFQRYLLNLQAVRVPLPSQCSWVRAIVSAIWISGELDPERISAPFVV